MTQQGNGHERTKTAPHRVLILGGGFAGVMTAQELEKRFGDRTDVEIWLVSRDNFMLFTPLLPEVTSGNLEPRHVVTPLRGMVRHKSTWCITADVEKIDTAARVVTVMGGDGDAHRLHYDTLVLALGGVSFSFGIPGLDEHAVGMKSLADAFSLRNRAIEMLERADIEEEPAARQADLTFIVGGGGFSGVETAGELEDFVRRVRRRYYPKIGKDELRFYLIERDPELLREVTPRMGRWARKQLTRRGYDVRVKTSLREVREDAAVIGDGEVVPTRTVIWAGGVRPAPVVSQAGLEVDHAGRVNAKGTMETSRPEVFAIGDCAVIENVDAGGKPFAPTAQNAVREAKVLADNIVARIDGAALRPFRYRPIGTLASIGAYSGVGRVFGVQVRGFIAWVMWRGYYWSRVPGINRKVRVAMDWALTFLFGTDSVQLKVEDVHSALGSSGRRRPRVPEEVSR